MTSFDWVRKTEGQGFWEFDVYGVVSASFRGPMAEQHKTLVSHPLQRGKQQVKKPEGKLTSFFHCSCFSL